MRWKREGSVLLPANVETNCSRLTSLEEEGANYGICLPCAFVSSALRLQPFIKYLYTALKQQNIHCIHLINAALPK